MALAHIPSHGMMADEFLALPAGEFDPLCRYQLIEGVVFMAASPTFWHQQIVTNLMRILDRWCEQGKTGLVFPGPVDYRVNDTSVLVPDVLFYRRERLPGRAFGHLISPPDLVVEILSPSTRKIDMVEKRSIYAGGGVREYWIVDPKVCMVEVLILRGEEYDSLGAVAEGGTLTSPLLVDFSVPVEEVFRGL